MSPPHLLVWQGMLRFPRVSGDEPLLEAAAALQQTFSPRERG